MRLAGVEIRPADVADAEALTDLHLEVWEEAYADLVAADVLRQRRRNRAARLGRWRASIAEGDATTLLACRAGRLLGFVSVGAARDGDVAGLPACEVWALYVRAKVYGLGVGHRLLGAAIGEDPAYLWVLDGNARAIAFYQRQGFVLDGATKTEPVGLERRMVRRSAPGRVPGCSGPGLGRGAMRK